MKNKVISALAIMTVIASLGTEVSAQSPKAPNSNTGNYTSTGNSLNGIDNRTSDEDFARFFGNPNPQNSISRSPVEDNSSRFDVWQIGNQVQVRRKDSVTAPNDVIFPQGDESFYGNEGVKVQVDLGGNR